MSSAEHGPSADHDGLLAKFTQVFANDDLPLLYSIIADDCEWSIMATGEHFRGIAEIRVLNDKVQAARGHSDDAHVHIKESFRSDDRLCIEFLHRGVVKQGFSSDPDTPAEGSLFEIDFCATAQVRDGRIVRVREYFDHTQFATPPEKRVKFFS